MNITAKSSIVMDLSHKRINERKGIGIHQLQFIYSYILKSWEVKTFTAHNARLIIYLKGEKRHQRHYIGTASPRKPFNFVTPQICMAQRGEIYS